jgi:serine/threonine protein kinase
MDYINGDKLDEFNDKSKKSLSFWTKIFIMKNITNGLRFLQTYDIIHLDLKPSNIIITHGLLSKIIDFG